MFFTGAQAMQNMASGASDLTEELSEIAGEVIHSDLLFNERTVTILGIALVLLSIFLFNMKAGGNRRK